MMRWARAYGGLVSLLALACLALGAGEREPGWLGIELGRATPGDSTADARPGVPVTGVVADSPAARAGLRARDRILALDGSPVSAAEELRALLRDTGSGSWISLSIERGDEERTLDARLSGVPPSGTELRMLTGWIGIEAIDLPEALRLHFGAPADSGILVAGVVAGSPAAIAGIEVGDVVHAVDGEGVTSVGDFARRIGRGGIGNTVEVALFRAGAAIVVEATIGLPPTVESPYKG